MSYQLTAWEIVQNHIQIILVLQTLVDTAAKVTLLELFEDVSFINDVLYLLLARYLSLFQTFEGEVLAVALVTHQFHGPKATSPQYLQNLKVFKTE